MLHARAGHLERFIGVLGVVLEGVDLGDLLAWILSFVLE